LKETQEAYKNVKESIYFVNASPAHDPKFGETALTRAMGIAPLDKFVVGNNTFGDIVTMLTVTVCRQQVSGRESI